jgi:diguanylate cyclase (GGDEF)-like protein
MGTRDDIKASEDELVAARQSTARMGPIYGLMGVCVVGLIALPAAFLAAQLASGAWVYLLTAGFVAGFFAPVVVVMVHSSLVMAARGEDAMATLEHRLRQAIQRSEHESRLANALEMAEGEPEVLAVVERALALTVPSAPVELLLADNSHAHLTRMATSSPTGDPPRCEVDSPDQCPAARRAQVQQFTDSEALDACPKLRGRAQGPCAAVCVPVSIMGRTVGVIHATADQHAEFEESALHGLGTLAKLAGARIGLLRMMTETQLQASTDSLTGLLNRRSLENNVQMLRHERRGFVVAMADLDNFKQLNDVHGHETGDRALRLFAQTLRTSLRDLDIVSRHGGEEFAVVMPDCGLADASIALDRFRTHLIASIQASGLPEFTVSVGIVDATESENFAEVLARADAALLEAKRTGRDQVVAHGRHGEPVTFDAGNHPAEARASLSLLVDT